MNFLDGMLARATASLTLLLVTTVMAQAGAFYLRDQSATAGGESFAGVAAGSGGLSSMFWNPATITMTPGIQTEAHGSVVLPYANIEPDAATRAEIAGFGATIVPVPPTGPLAGRLGSFGPFGSAPFDSGNIGQTSLVPSSYSSYQVSDRLWVGLSVNGPFGLVTKADPFYAGQIYGRSSRLFTLNATPTIGVKLTDWLSIGAGVQIQYIDVSLARAVPAPIGLSTFQRTALLRGGATLAQINQINTSLAGLSAVSLLAPTGRIKGDDVGVGYTLGMTLTPMAGTEIGIGFRSSIHHEVQGDISPALGLTEPVRAPVNLPEIVTVGLSQQIGAQFKLLAGYEFTNWSRIKDVPIVNRIDGTIPTTLNFRYRDGHFFSLGGEYLMSPALTLRAGVAYELSPITDRTRSVNLPDNDRIWASIGLGYKVTEKLSVDASYYHIFVQKAPIRLVPGNPQYVDPLFFTGRAKPTLDIVELAVKYQWDNPRAAIPAELIARKY
jgi:long-chain fatty acid transport protein